jgi:hypothetical protein
MQAYLQLGDRDRMHISNIAPISNYGAPQPVYRIMGCSWGRFCMRKEVTNRYPRGCHVR